VAALAPAAWCVAQPNEAAVRYLDVARTMLTQPVDPTVAKAGETKFVEVQVADVVNPANAGLTFEVHFEATGAPRVLLGTFSLFPANNPGTFLVATQGKVDRTGTLMVTMLVTDPVPPGAALRVGIGRLGLSTGLPRN